jgi:hypothetical protein
LQRITSTQAEPVLVRAGAAGILSVPGSAIVASLSAGGLDTTRRAVAKGTSVPLLYVRAGLKPGGLAPERTLTRFSWSLHDEAG